MSNIDWGRTLALYAAFVPLGWLVAAILAWMTWGRDRFEHLPNQLKLGPLLFLAGLFHPLVWLVLLFVVFPTLGVRYMLLPVFAWIEDLGKPPEPEEPNIQISYEPVAEMPAGEIHRGEDDE